MIFSIQKADYLGEYKIAFLFSDGIKKSIDFGSFLKGSKNSSISKYLDKELFKSFSIEYGDILWNDYEMCFPISDLHEGKI